jgi:type VI secretion system protein ImpE
MPVQPSGEHAGLAEQVAAAVDTIRANPQALAPRMALFQLDCVTGVWQRARAQLATMAKLDPEAALFAQLYERLIQSEGEREAVFAGRVPPVAVGEPSAWMAMLAKALEFEAKGDAASARDFRARALEEAPARPGSIDGADFAWIMDADPRLGPTLEVVVDGNYRWLALENVLRLRAPPPKALRDAVWQKVDLTLANKSEIRAFVPVRYPGSASHPNEAVQLARLTIWENDEDETERGYGQRLLATDAGDRALLDLRRLEFTSAPAGARKLG